MVDIRGCTKGLPVLVQRVVAAAGLQHQPLDPGHFPLEKERSLELLVLQVVISGVVAHHVHPILVSAQRLEIIRSGPVGLPIRMIEEDMACHLGTRKIGYVALVERSGQIQSHGQAPGDLHVYIRTDIVLAVLAARFLETVALHQLTDRKEVIDAVRTARHRNIRAVLRNPLVHGPAIPVGRAISRLLTGLEFGQVLGRIR